MAFNCSSVHPYPYSERYLSSNQWPTTNREPDARNKAHDSFQKEKRKNRIMQENKGNYSKAKKSKDTKLDFKAMMRDFLDNSSVYVLNRIGNSTSTTRKIFWILILIMGAGGCLSQVGLFLESYYDYPVIVNLDSMTANIHPFPAVTVCNVNSYRKVYEPCVELKLNYNECYGANPKNKTDYFRTKNTALPECERDIINYSNMNETRKKWLYSLLSLNYESRVVYGHQPQDLIEFCSFIDNRCFPEHFESSLSQLYGNCYTFNSGKHNLTTQNNGPIHGFVLELNLEVDKYGKFTQAAGARVEVHDPHLHHRADLKGIFVGPGYETNIAVTKSILSRLPPPYKDRCKYYSKGESQLTCKYKCIQNITESLCSCTTSIGYQSSLRHCDLTDALTRCCVTVSEKKANDICNCPLSCEEIIYDIEVSSSVWPSRMHYENYRELYLTSNITAESLSYEDFRETKLRLRVYYDTLDYTVYKQNPMYQTSEIFSQVGGQMGLWLGLSLVIVIECLESIYTMCRKKMSNFHLNSDHINKRTTY